MSSIDEITASFNVTRTEVVGAQRISESKKGKKTSWARQTEVEKEHEPRVNPVPKPVSLDLPPIGMYNSKGEIIEPHKDEKDLDLECYKKKRPQIDIKA